MAEPHAKNWLEWAVFGLGCILVLIAAGSLGYEMWFATPTRSPQLDVRLGKPEHRADHYAVPVTVSNRGDETAEQVHVEVTFQYGDGQSERAQLQIAHLPQQSKRTGYVTFTRNPAGAGRLTARPVGYEKR